MYPLVLPAVVPELALYQLGQADTLGHVLVLQEFEDDVAFGRVRVESGVLLLVVIFNQNHRVFLLGDFQVLLCTVQTEGVGFRAAYPAVP